MSIFTDHPNSVGETYGEHMATAFGFGGRMVVSGLACIVHGIFPFWFNGTGSRAVHELSKRMIHGRDKFDGSVLQGTQKDWCI